MTGTIEHLDPNTLQIADNVRDDAALDAHFLSSVREHGVLQPITATRDADGVHVRDGQRRTLAAREAGLADIPVYVLDGTDDGPAARIAHQIVSNDQRTALTDAQRVKGINQMLLAGVTPTRVAQSLSVDKGTVTAARTAAASERAMDVLAAGQLDLMQAAALTEFDDDPDAVSALIAAAGGPMFDHRVAQLRADRKSAQARTDAENTYTEQGFTILRNRPGWRDTETVALEHLRTADGNPATEADVTDPAHWAVLLTEDPVLVDAATGDEVEDRDVDWDTEGDADATPAEGLRHADTVEERSVWDPEYFCLDAEACGLGFAEYFTRGNDSATNRDAVDDAEVAEAQRRERRKVVTLNKLGLAAEEVRRAFVRDTLLARLVDCTSADVS